MTQPDATAELFEKVKAHVAKLDTKIAATQVKVVNASNTLATEQSKLDALTALRDKMNAVLLALDGAA